MTLSAFVNDRIRKQYQLRLDKDLMAVVDYVETDDNEIILAHTGVPPELAGKGAATTLIKLVLQDIKDRGMHVAPVCSFVSAYIERHPEWSSLISK